jgi:hypothetical protein
VSAFWFGECGEPHHLVASHCVCDLAAFMVMNLLSSLDAGADRTVCSVYSCTVFQFVIIFSHKFCVNYIGALYSTEKHST